MPRPGVLYVVATPLGNLEDITLRALRVLREVHWIAAEDTRETAKLLRHYGIATRLTAYHDWIEREQAPRLVERLLQGENGALVSDAGTPVLSDPGFHLVRSALAAGIRIVPVPGPSAIVAALCAAGLPAQRFVFEGFLPARASARRARLQELARETRTLVMFETARRLPACLQDMEAVWGARTVVVARELTKLYEEFLRGTPAELLAELSRRQAPVRGEVTLVAEGCPEPPAQATRARPWQEKLAELLASGVSLRDAAKLIAREYGLSRREVYAWGLHQR